MSRCDCCGDPGSGSEPTIGIVRGLAYAYCGPDCRDRHAEAVRLTGPGCELCDEDALGDTTRCAEHLEAELRPGWLPEPVGWPLAS